MDKCFFCKCIKDNDYALENEYAIARYDDFPVNKGHLEIIPKRHVKDWWETTIEERIDKAFHLSSIESKKSATCSFIGPMSTYSECNWKYFNPAFLAFCLFCA